MKYSGKVLIEKVKEKTGRTSVANMHAVSNVNVAQGPRTGNHGTPAKRSDFQDAKAARAPLAAVIEHAYGLRAPRDHVEAKLESIRSDVNEGRRKK